MVDINIIIQATLTVVVLTFLYKENVFYRVAEYLSIASTSSVLLVSAVRNIEKFSIKKIQGGQYIFIIGTILGLLLYTRYTEKYNWLSRYAIAVLVGTSFGLSITSTFKSQVVDQIVATSELPLVGVPIMTTIQNIIIITMVVSIITYFTYTFWGKGKPGAVIATMRDDESVAGKITGVDVIVKMGRYSLMAGFGTILGNMVMDRMAYAIHTIRTLLGIFGIAQF